MCGFAEFWPKESVHVPEGIKATGTKERRKQIEYNTIILYHLSSSIIPTPGHLCWLLDEKRVLGGQNKSKAGAISRPRLGQAMKSAYGHLSPVNNCVRGRRHVCGCIQTAI
jgi:hypothetical protein